MAPAIGFCLALFDRPSFSELKPNMSSGRGRRPGGSSHLNIDLQAHPERTTMLTQGKPMLTEGKPREGKRSDEKKAARSNA